VTIDVLSVKPLCDRARCAAKFIDLFEEGPPTEETVCEMVFEAEEYENALQCCEEALITCAPDEALANLKADGHSLYQLTDRNGRQFQMIIEEALPGALRVYKGAQPFGELSPGMAELVCVFDRDRFPDLAKLEAFGLDDLPSFHESRLEVLSREGDALRLYVYDGYFTSIDMTMTLSGITREECRMDDADDPWAYFAQKANVGEVALYSEPEGYRVKIMDNYNDAVNALTIRCEGLELSFERREGLPG